MNRQDSKNIISDVINISKREGGILIGLSPEGTRKKAEKWKSGFLRMAQSMECPILLATIDYPSKEISFREY